jgi:WD40 repeat protein
VNTNRIFRLFISSTFSDFQREREALQGTVFPKLEAYCASKGARFQAIDLRWGITELAQNERDTMRICLEEIRRSQQLSPRPNFAVLLGDRYGSEPVPSRIPQTQWKRLMAAASVADRKVIREAFESQPDRNAVPPVYCLKPRQGERSLSVERDAIVRDALRRAATAFEGNEEWLPFFTSATHQEILLGALKSDDSRKHVHVYVRQIDRLPTTEEAKAFIDWDKETQKPVEGARERLAGLELQLRGKLQERVHDIQARWTGNGVSDDHIPAFCDRFFEDHVAIIDRELQELGNEDEAQARVRLHEEFAIERARNFTGRSGILRRIVSYLGSRDNSPAPLVLHGEGGSGKSAILAHAFMKARSRTPTAVVVARFIGGVPGTESLVLMLSALTQDIAHALDLEKPSIAASTREAADAFDRIISHSKPERPLWLFLDALDQLSSDDSAWVLEWLPKHMSPHTRMVVSMREGPVLQAAQRRFPRALLQVPPMSVSEGSRMLSSLLSSSREARYDAGTAPTTGRRLTAPQRRRLLEQFSSSGSPLWLKLAYEDARSWHSWSKARELPHDVAGMVKDLIGRRLLEGEKHMPLFTRRSLAYLAAGRFGLAEEELAKALGADPEVRDEFRKNEKTDKSWPDSRPLLPPILWSRLHFDLEPYLSEANIDGALVYRFFHREFKEVVEQALLQDEANRDIHTRLAEKVFSKPAGDDLFRKTDAGGIQESAALRRIMEQPWQLAQAGKNEELANLLTDFGFCMAKCAANRSDDLVNDFRTDGVSMEANTAFAIWRDFVQTNSHLLNRGQDDWPAHKILLQLAVEHADDSPVTLSAEAFLNQEMCHWTWLRRISRPPQIVRGALDLAFGGKAALPLPDGRLITWSPSICIWDPRTGNLIVKLDGFRGQLQGVAVLDRNRITSWSDDCHLYVWSLLDFTCQIVLSGHTKTILGILPIETDKLLSWSSDNTLRLWSIPSGVCVATFAGHTDEIKEAKLLGNSRILSWSKDATVRIWNLASLECTQIFAGHSEGIKDIRVLRTGDILSIGSYTQTSGTSLGCIWDPTTGKRIFTFVIGPSNYQQVIEAADGRIYWCSRDGEIMTWSSRGEDAKIVFKGHTDQFSTITLSPNGKLLSGTFEGEIWSWDVNTGQCLYVVKPPAPKVLPAAGSTPTVQKILLLPRNRFLTVHGSGTTMQIWDEATGGHIMTLGDDSQGLKVWTRDVELLPNGRLFSWDSDGVSRIWDIESGRRTLRFDLAYWGMTRPFALNDGRLVSVSDADFTVPHSSRMVYVWNPTAVEAQNSEGHERAIEGVTIANDNTAISYSRDNTLRIWDTHTEACLAVLRGHTDEVRGCNVVRDDRLLSWSRHGEICLWDTVEKECLLRIKAVQICTAPLVGTLLLKADGVLGLWDIGTGDCLNAMDVRQRAYGAFLVDSRKLLAWFEDGKFRSWDILTHEIEELQSPPYKAAITEAQLLADGGIASWSDIGELYIWYFGSSSRIIQIPNSQNRIKRLSEFGGNGIKVSYWDGSTRTWHLECGHFVEDAYAPQVDQEKLLEPSEILSKVVYGSASLDSWVVYGQTGRILAANIQNIQQAQWHGSASHKVNAVAQDGRVIANDTVRILILQTFSGKEPHRFN